LSWQWTPASGILSVASNIALNPTNVTANISAGTLVISWPRDHTGWRLETNAIGIADANSWFTLPGSTTTNQIFLPINSASRYVFFRLVFP
jgi:hypothetical protein